MLDKAKTTALEDIRKAMKGGLAARLKAKHAPPEPEEKADEAEAEKPLLHVTAIKIAPHEEPDEDDAGGPPDGDEDDAELEPKEALKAALSKHLASMLPGHHKR